MHEQDNPYHADGSPTGDPYDGMSWLAKYASQRSIFVMSRIRFFGNEKQHCWTEFLSHFIFSKYPLL